MVKHIHEKMKSFIISILVLYSVGAVLLSQSSEVSAQSLSIPYPVVSDEYLKNRNIVGTFIPDKSGLLPELSIELKAIVDQWDYDELPGDIYVSIYSGGKEIAYSLVDSDITYEYWLAHICATKAGSLWCKEVDKSILNTNPMPVNRFGWLNIAFETPPKLVRGQEYTIKVSADQYYNFGSNLNMDLTITPEKIEIGSPGSTNLTHAYDQKETTSANILADDGYIIYNLNEIGLSSGKTTFLIGASDGNTHTIQLDFLNSDVQEMNSQPLIVSGYKKESYTSIPEGAEYIKINAAKGVFLYIYEMEETDNSSMTSFPQSKGATNITEAYDGKDNTSANILSNDGYIMYNLSDIGLTDNATSHSIIGVSNGSTQNIKFEFFNDSLEEIENYTMSVSGYKMDYSFRTPLGAAYVKINAVNDAFLYIYEMTSVAEATQTFPRGKGGNNLDHIYDGKDHTSANILSNDGYIMYKLADIGLTSGSTSKYIIGVSNGSKQTIQFDYSNDRFEEIESKTLTIDGYKKEYTTEIPMGAAYVKINAASGAFVYFYEVMDKSETTRTFPESKGANNVSHAYDGKDNTSGNILSGDGFITYKLSDIGLKENSTTKLIISTSDGSAQELKVDYLNSYIQKTSSQTLKVSGFNKKYMLEIPSGATYITINGVSGAFIYIYEVGASENLTDDSEKSEAITPLTCSEYGVSNVTHAYDGKYTTSANIFVGGECITYKLADIGLHQASITYLIGVSDRSIQNIKLEYYNEELQAIGSSVITTTTDSKKEYVTKAPDGATYVKIFGGSGAAIYIYELSSTTVTKEPEFSRGATNLTHAYDGLDHTSANILNPDGYIIYSLAEIGLTTGTSSKCVISSSNGSAQSIQFEYLDGHLQPLESEVLSIMGYKNEYTINVPTGAVHVKIHAGTESMYIFEIW